MTIGKVKKTARAWVILDGDTSEVFPYSGEHDSYFTPSYIAKWDGEQQAGCSYHYVEVEYEDD